MDINDAYRAPDSDVLEHVDKPPKLIKVAYFLILLLIVIGVVDSLLLIDFSSDDLVFEYVFLVFYVLLTLLISWFLYKPIRDRSEKSSQLPFVLAVIYVGFICLDIYEGTFLTVNSDIAGIIELGVILAIFSIIRSTEGKGWCNTRL